MNKRINRKLGIVLGLLISSCSVHAISDQTAHMATACMAVLSTAANGYGWYTVSELQKFHPAVFGITSLLMTGVTYYYLNSITPVGRIKRANILLKKLLRYKLIKVSFEQKNDFFDAVHDEFLQEDLPLISAYKQITRLLSDIGCAFDLLNKASAEAQKDTITRKKYNASLICAKKLFKNMSVALKRIREHKNYLSQLALYKEFLNSTKQTIAQEQMAHAQLQMAHAQQGYTLLKLLKWIKAILPI